MIDVNLTISIITKYEWSTFTNIKRETDRVDKNKIELYGVYTKQTLSMKTQHRQMQKMYLDIGITPFTKINSNE